MQCGLVGLSFCYVTRCRLACRTRPHFLAGRNGASDVTALAPLRRVFASRVATLPHFLLLGLVAPGLRRRRSRRRRRWVRKVTVHVVWHDVPCALLVYITIIEDVGPRAPTQFGEGGGCISSCDERGEDEEDGAL